MNEPNIPTAAPEQNAPAATEPTAPQTAAEEIVTVGALRGAIERRQEHCGEDCDDHYNDQEFYQGE